jgi:L-iditol 2-dehydrogenase
LELKEMRAATLVGPGVVEVRDFDVPQATGTQVVVEMHYASICGSDVHVVFDGFHNPDMLGRPGYPSHEGIGVVADGGASGLAVGTPVLTVPHGQRGGCFAEYQAVETAYLVALPEGVDLRRTLLAQQLGTTIFGMKKFLPADTPAEAIPRKAVVIGAGSAGLFFLQLLLERGIEVTVADLNAGRLEVARRLGAARTVHEPAESVIEVVSEATAGEGVDLVIEAAGYDVARAAAVETARSRGTVGFFGYPELKGPAPFPVERSFRKSLTMEWINGTQAEHGLASFRAAVDMITNDEIVVDYCLESMYDLEETPAALAAARAQGHGAPKVGVVMPGAHAR